MTLLSKYYGKQWLKMASHGKRLKMTEKMEHDTKWWNTMENYGTRRKTML